MLPISNFSNPNTYITLRDCIPHIAFALECNEKEEALNKLLGMPLSPSTISAIAGDIVLNKIRASRDQQNEDCEVINETVSELSASSKAGGSAPKKLTNSRILKDLGLPFQIGVLKGMVPDAKPPGKLSDKAKLKELEDIKAFVLQALEKLTPNMDKRVYVLRHVIEGDTAGKIYLNAFAGPFKIFDTKPSLVKSRPAKLVDACRLILGEIPPAHEQIVQEEASTVSQ